MNNAKKLTVQDIINLPKASVIWKEEHHFDENYNIGYYELFPMLVCVPGENGVLAWACKSYYCHLFINENLIDENTSFWDCEPDPDMISNDISETEYDKFLETVLE